MCIYTYTMIIVIGNIKQLEIAPTQQLKISVCITFMIQISHYTSNGFQLKFHARAWSDLFVQLNPY